MAGLAIFLAPIAAIMSSDYWLVKKRKIDVPSLYRRHARYRYDHGINWRAAVAFLVSVVPNVPGLAKAVNPSLDIGEGAQHIHDVNYLYGFISAFVLYWALSIFFPAKETLLTECIYDDETITGIEYQTNVDQQSSRDGEHEKRAMAYVQDV